MRRYAEYARQGFWQLLAAATLTLAVVKAASVLAQTGTRARGILLHALLGLLCALTVVTLASALHRLRLYESAFGLTRPRLAAEAFGWWLGGIFVLLLLSPANPRPRLLVRLVLVWTAASLTVFSIVDPDARIAERNVERWRETGRIDLIYLKKLSADAVPALSELPRPLRERALERVAQRLAEDEPWTAANLSRHRAREILAEQ